VQDLFKEIRRVKEDEGKHINVFCSFLQIYNERVFDLLNQNSLKSIKNTDPLKQGLRIRWTKKEQFVVENLFVFECQTAQDVLQLFNSGIKNKVVASHNLNHASSRSHAIFTITVETVDPSNLDNVVTSKLQLVDLAGSEKISATGTTG
jgi:kinesin family protein 4/21/27